MKSDASTSLSVDEVAAYGERSPLSNRIIVICKS